MNKDRVKSIILVLLIIFNLVLAERILVDERLWPTGYNLFNIRSVSKNGSDSAAQYLNLPERIIVNTGYQTSRFEYIRSSEEFGRIYETSKNIITSALLKPEKDILTVLSDEWYSALTGKSVYLAYPCKFSAQNFAALLGMSTELNFKGFSDIVIADTGTVYISDTLGGAFYKVDITSPEISPIIDAALSEELNSSVINYSFDLNFDKDFGDQKTFLSPMIPIYSEPVQSEVIESSNPIFKGSEINQKSISGILAAFSINPGTVWRYTEADGSLVFVENTGILKISPDGLLTFSATADGIALSGDSANSVASEVAELVGKVNSGAGCNADMYITSPILSDTISELSFDYIFGGIPVRFNGINAAQITIKNGRITEYAQILRKYTPCGYTEPSPLYIETLDNIIAKYSDSMSQINITKMFPAYIDKQEQGKLSPDWFVEIDNVIAE